MQYVVRLQLGGAMIAAPMIATLSVGCGSAAIELLTLPGAKIVMQAAPSDPAPVDQSETVKVTETKVEFEQKIAFQSWKAELLDESASILDEIAKVLEQHPEITRIEIQGHTAEAPNPRRLLLLSKQRAEAVRAYLVDRGIEASRLAAKGYGATKPIAENDSPEGREQNRRVEFVIVERSGPSANNMVAADSGGSQ